MRKKDIEKEVNKAQKAIEEALKPFRPCCQRRIMKAVIVLLTDCDIR